MGDTAIEFFGLMSVFLLIFIIVAVSMDVSGGLLILSVVTLLLITFALVYPFIYSTPDLKEIEIIFKEYIKPTPWSIKGKKSSKMKGNMKGKQNKKIVPIMITSIQDDTTDLYQVIPTKKKKSKKHKKKSKDSGLGTDEDDNEEIQKILFEESYDRMEDISSTVHKKSGAGDLFPNHSFDGDDDDDDAFHYVNGKNNKTKEKEMGQTKAEKEEQKMKDEYNGDITQHRPHSSTRPTKSAR